MNLGKTKRISLSMASGVLLLAGLLLLLHGTPQIVRADPGDFFVKPGASGSCTQSDPCELQTALDTATAADTIYAAGGTYTGSGGAVVAITQSLDLVGGWDGASSGPVRCDPNAYPTTLDAEGARRVAYIGGTSGAITVTLTGLTVTNGVASVQGAGLYAQDAVLSLRHVTIYSNVVDGAGIDYVYGGGAYVSGGTLHITDSIVRSNHCTHANLALHGGGLFISGTLTTTVESTLVEGNSAWNCGGMWFGHGTLLIRQSRFRDNGFNVGFGATSYAGGLRIQYAEARIEDTEFTHNYAGAHGAAMDVWDSSLLLARSVIADNRAPSSGLGVAGIYISGQSPFTLTNNLIVNNQPRRADAGVIYVASTVAPGYLLHNTIAGNTGSNGGTGIFAKSDITLTNNILVSHTVGISVTAGYTAAAEGTLWGSGSWANGVDWGGDGTVVTGTVNIWDNPGFVNPGAGDYQIDSGSAAVDAGVSAGVATDIQGMPRDAAPDIGAYEWKFRLFLPVALKDAGM